MTIDAETINVIEKKAALYDTTKERVAARIREYAETAMDSLRAAEAELLDFVEIEFGENPFSEFLSTLGEDSESDNNPLNKKVRAILSKEIRGDFGPDEETFNSLLSAIDSFKSQRRKMKRMLFDSTPRDLRCSSATCNTVSVSWERVDCDCFYELELKSPSTVTTHRSLKAEYSFRGLRPGTEYIIRVRTVITHDNSPYLWSDPITIETEWGFSECGWKECPDNVEEDKKYIIDEGNPRIASKNSIKYNHFNFHQCCTIIGNVLLPPNKFTSWNIKILKSEKNNGDRICIGVAPFDIDQNEEYNHRLCGWYFYCDSSKLLSGPPHFYDWKEYGPRKERGQYVHTGDSVGVVMDTAKGELSFVLNEVNLGVAFEGIPLDKPLVPCVLLEKEYDSIEFIHLTEKRVEMESSVLIPSNITTKSSSWNSITLTWDAAEGASFYQIEVDGSKFWNSSKTNTLTKTGLLPETEHTFRVRSVKENKVGRWSNVVRGRTQKESFETSSWKECPDFLESRMKYLINENNPRVITKILSKGYYPIVDNTPLPPNKVTSWSIKILKSQNNDGRRIFVGVAPFDINGRESYNKYGWYFDCYRSTLRSGHPRIYTGPDKEYGPRKTRGSYIHDGVNVGVVMDTTKGELSFVLDGVNLGVAFEGIPLDKPLAPCVLLKHIENSVELDTSEVKENVDSSIPVPSNITAKSITWDSITLIWDAVEGASFYQIEVDGSKFWDASTTNRFTKRGFFPDTEYSFRVRAVRRNLVGEWSNIVKSRTLNEALKYSIWKECPDNVVDGRRKYSVDEENPRIATFLGDKYGSLCPIIGNTALPLNKVTSWSIKILKSYNNNGGGIYIGVAPFDINLNGCYDYNKYGWYFECYYSALYSGPPQNYGKKVYGPRKGYGEYVRTGNSVGVVMNTTTGELSFVLNGVNHGVGFEGIPLDKPLVSCVIFGTEGDSVELIPLGEKENVAVNSIPVPSNITAKSITWDSITLAWNAVGGASFYQIETDGGLFFYLSQANTFTKRGFLPETEHVFRIRAVKGNSVGKWSSVTVKGKTLKESFETSGWKECPDDLRSKMKYFIDSRNPRVASKYNAKSSCIIIGNTPLPPNKVTSWSIKMFDSESPYIRSFCIGVIPSNKSYASIKSYERNGWYFRFGSGVQAENIPNNEHKEYGPREGNGKYIRTGDSVGVVVDTAKGELSFVVNGVNRGVAYAGLPLGKPLVPCVILEAGCQSVKLDTSEVKENVDTSIPAPSNITAESITWDSITLTWNAVEEVLFYQIETDGSKKWDASTTNTFTKRDLFPDTEHTFRVRVVRGNSVSEWSVAVKKTLGKSFKTSRWKECPGYFNQNRKYSVDDNNFRIATKIKGDYGYYYCTIIGNTPLPPNKVTSWSIKILKSQYNNGEDIYIGVTPSDINQNKDNNLNKCGWYFYCFDSTLRSGPPHNYGDKEYGPRKGSGEYVHAGDSVGVVMDTVKGELSFVLNGVNHGIAYEGIPLDKPLVPCVLLKKEGDSVELDTSEVKDIIVDSSVPVPSNITTKSTTWDSITLTWDVVEGASFYQIEVDERKPWDGSATNTFRKKGLLPETEHAFKVRAVRGSLVSEWSDVVKWRTLEGSFETGHWKECPENVKKKMRYFIDEINPRIATMSGDDCCTIAWDKHIPVNIIASWNIKILRSKENVGSGIYIGVAPSDIDQNSGKKSTRCGWFLDCYESRLWSGPPDNRKGKMYGPRKGDGEYVHTGDSVVVAMDTTNWKLSFVLDGVNLGVAYEGIPLDKPLVPCVLLGNEGDSIEFII